MDNNYSPFVSPANKDNCALSELTKTILRSELSSDSIIPDTIPDADKVLLCTATPRIEGKFIRDNTLDIEGSMTYEILLATEKNTISSLTLNEPFTMKHTVKGLDENCHIMLLPSINYVTAKLLNPRKVNLRSQIDLSLHVFAPIHLDTEVLGSESLNDDMNLQRRIISLPSADFIAHEEHGIPVSYDMELDSSAPPAAEIVSSRLRLYPQEMRVRNEEADLRTGAFVSVIYRTEEDNYFTIDKNFVVEKTLNYPAEDRGEWSATVTPVDFSAGIAANSYGEMKIIEIDFSYDLVLNTLKNKSVAVVSDMYSTEFACESTKTSHDVLHLRRVYSSGLTVNASASRETIGADKLRAIFGGAVLLKEPNVAYTSTKGKLLIEGKAEIDLIGENNIVDDNEELFAPFHYEYPFRCEIDSGEDLQDSDFILSCAVNEIKFRADSSSIYTDFEITARVIVLDKEPTEQVAQLRLDRSSPVAFGSSPMTLCYPSGHESLWDIAKHYKIAPEQIVEANGLTSNDIHEKKVLLIPHTEPKRPVFSKVI